MRLKNILVAIIAVILVAWIIVAMVNNQENIRTADNQGNAPTPPPSWQTQLTTTAKTYTSDRLGITFTYEPNPFETFEVTVTERDNKIYLHGTNESLELAKTIEVFDKDASVSLEEAIKQRFLQDRSEQDCFVVSIERSAEDPRPESYRYAEIGYPPPTDPNAPFWENAENCPVEYSRTNAVQFFMMNQDVPDKFVFVALGQDSITTDGTPVSEDGSRRDWSASIRIIK